ncbi:MAG: hypothetical protein J6S41_07530 [Clostridia bacterium]|nr:hypothetical protein [Clostridia bacterium]
MKRFILLLVLTLTVVCFAACSAKTPTDAPAIDAAALSFDAEVYYARDGRMRFLYDPAVDMLSAMEGYDMAALYSGTVYSMVIQYTEGTVSRKDADAQVKAEFTADGVMEVSSKTEAVTVSGHTFRRAEITASDGSRGAVLYGSTDTGFGKIYYLLSPTATDAESAHVNEILSTVTFAEFESGDGDDGVKIYIE